MIVGQAVRQPRWWTDNANEIRMPRSVDNLIEIEPILEPKPKPKTHSHTGINIADASMHSFPSLLHCH